MKVVFKNNGFVMITKNHSFDITITGMSKLLVVINNELIETDITKFSNLISNLAGIPPVEDLPRYTYFELGEYQILNDLIQSDMNYNLYDWLEYEAKVADYKLSVLKS